MRTVARPGAIFATLVRKWLHVGGRICTRWRYASSSNAFGAETSAAPLSDLIEALAPLGMPDTQYALRRSGGGWITQTRAAAYAVVSRAHPTAINVVAVLVIHLAAIRYVFLAVGTT